MGKLLGAYADDQELNRPDLNKCPDCNCFFEGENCPLCGKECPEEMHAGNRPEVKAKKRKRSSGTGRVTFIDWYHSWWFIGLMIIIFPVIGIILLFTSPHERWKKILFIAIAVVYAVISTLGISNIISEVTNMFDPPVEDTLTKSEYVSKCEVITPEQFIRSNDGYKDRFVCTKLKIVRRVTYTDSFYNDKDYLCYLCEDESGSDYKFVLRDCLLEDQQRLISGDVVTVYGEGGGECEVYDDEYNYYTLPCLNMAYIVLE